MNGDPNLVLREYEEIRRLLPGQKWDLVHQKLVMHEHKLADSITVVTESGVEYTFYFTPTG